MKTLVEKSIKFHGIGHPETKTVFDIESDAERDNIRFKPLDKISGRKLSISFNYLDEQGEKPSRISLTIITSTDEEEIKQFIIDRINDYLNQ
jgi:hypothetical protein